jgi:hypothetical protein
MTQAVFAITPLVVQLLVESHQHRSKVWNHRVQGKWVVGFGFRC